MSTFAVATSGGAPPAVARHHADRRAGSLPWIAVTAGIAVAVASAFCLGSPTAGPRPHAAATTLEDGPADVSPRVKAGGVRGSGVGQRAATSIAAPHGGRDAEPELLFLPAITETEISLERLEPRAAAVACGSPGDDSRRCGHVTPGYAVDPGILSANAADLKRLCRRLL